MDDLEYIKVHSSPESRLEMLAEEATEVSERTIGKFGDVKVAGLYVTEKMLTE